MSTITTKEMRKVQKFISWDEWPKELEKTTRCLHYALGIPVADPSNVLIKKILNGDLLENIEKIFQELEFKYHKISSTKDLKDSEYGIVIYDYLYKEYKNVFGCKWYEDTREVHFVRIESGIWTHKPGTYPTSITSIGNIRSNILEMDKVEVFPTAYFAIQKPQ